MLNLFVMRIASRCHFELDFRTQPFQVPVNEGHRQLSAAPTIGDRAVAGDGVELSVELGLVEAFGVTHVRKTEVILLRPEERHGVEPLPSSKDVTGCSLSLALGHHPMLHSDALAGEPIRPACDVTGREDAWCAGLEVLVYHDTTIDGESCIFGQGNRRPDA